VVPIIKIGQGETSVGSSSQAVAVPSYVSLQSKERSGFAIIVIPRARDFDGLSALALPPRNIAVQKTLATNVSKVRFDLGIYTGANELVRYYQEGYAELPDLFRPNILGRLATGIIWVLQQIHDNGFSWGMSIIALTLLFRIIIWPLITTQTRSMFGMQQLQPKIQALQKKFKEDREKLTQETMKLYRQAGVNPAGGCLPILVQMPLFIILWRVFVNFEFNEGFLWVPDLGLADPYFIMPILYVGVMLLQSWFSAKGNPSSLRQQVIINLVFAFIILSFPAGVILYFVVSMLVQVLQYWLISRNQTELALSKAK
jgi:YidC/Oxa1 family membrane protein insertase